MISRKESQRVVVKVEDAIRAAQYCESEIHRELVASQGEQTAPAPSNMPVALDRFLPERARLARVHLQDGPESGAGAGVIRWKEYSEETGIVRGAGQFYERPYAWLET